jgi:hypothetical protein
MRTGLHAGNPHIEAGRVSERLRPRQVVVAARLICFDQLSAI